MYDLTGKITGVSIAYDTDKPLVTLEFNEKTSALHMVDELKFNPKLSIKVDKFREKRSLNANNYAWLLITQIGNATRASKEDVYFLMLKRYGQSEMISVLSHIPISEYVKYSEEAGESVLNGKTFKHFRVFKGSSEFDTKEMSIFIDGIVYEAKELGIEVLSEREQSLLKERWNNG